MHLPLETLQQIFSYLPDEQIINIYHEIPEVRGYGAPLLKRPYSPSHDEEVFNKIIACGLRYKLQILKMHSDFVLKYVKNAYELYMPSNIAFSIGIDRLLSCYPPGKKITIERVHPTLYDGIIEELNKHYNIHEKTKSSLYVFASNYNVLRILSGMTTNLAYST